MYQAKKRVAGLACLFLATFALSAAGQQKGNAAEGKTLYAKQCASCHGADGAPKEALAKVLKVTMKHLGSKEVQAKSEADLRDDILKGEGKMKPVKVSEQQAVDIVAFIRTLTDKKKS